MDFRLVQTRSPSLTAMTHPRSTVLSDGIVTLRPWRKRDAPALERACGDREITQYTSVPMTYSAVAAQEWIAAQQKRTAEGAALILAVVSVDFGVPVGMAGLFGLDDPDGPRLGYWIVSEYRGRGLATRSAALLVAWAGEQRHRDGVMLEVEPGNAASRAVARRLRAIACHRHTVSLSDGRDVILDRFRVPA
jgi:RimJ/RimL family protein N-acetyltransferase